MDWIVVLLMSASTKVVVNGCPGESFAHARGLRQGDPLSPLIFVLAADLLQAAINDAMRKHLLHHPFKDDHDKDFPVIQYADDMLIIMQACTTQASLMKGLLTDYAESIGLCINFQKSTLIPLNVVPG